jgi:hypothetical protein
VFKIDDIDRIAHGPAENPSTGCLVSSASCRRSRRVLEDVGAGESGLDIVPEIDIDRWCVQVERKRKYEHSAFDSDSDNLPTRA